MDVILTGGYWAFLAFSFAPPSTLNSPSAYHNKAIRYYQSL